MRAPTDFLSLKPKKISFSEAAAVPLVGLTVTQCFEDNKLTAGQNVLVLGASGGTGYVAVQVAKVSSSSRAQRWHCYAYLLLLICLSQCVSLSIYNNSY